MSWLVAFVLALCVPFGQLRTNGDRITCCCPDQGHCKCPDHKGDHSGQPNIRACHKQTHDGLATELLQFVAPFLAVAAAPVARGPLPVFELTQPHDAPARDRPDAPS